VAVNLYPFRETVAKGDVPVAEAMEQVDIGGPTMVRAAAKSHRDVFVVVDPADYAAVLAEMDAADSKALRRRLAAKAFAHVSAYDAAITEYLGGDADSDRTPGSPVVAEGSPPRSGRSSPASSRSATARTPDQAGRVLRFGSRAGLAALVQHHGKELSYNNLLDLDGALLSLAPFALSKRAAVCIIKHTTPCGVAVADSLAEAYRKALATDPTSAFGSVIAVSREVDDATAEAMSELFIECLVAPGITEGAMATLSRRRTCGSSATPRRIRLGSSGATAVSPSLPCCAPCYGGVLAQTPAGPRSTASRIRRGGWRRRAPTEAEWDDLRFAWAADLRREVERDPARPRRRRDRDRSGPDEPRGRLQDRRA
jgi:phosphoribosylaminoimidazolecarboxamide formyltransferase / IMP cyclohydrolase